jgi:hypothetical protein
MPRREASRRALVHGLVFAGLVFAAYVFIVLAPAMGTFGYDTWAYWIVDLPHPYVVPLGGLGSFPYTPVAALVFDLADAVPWWIFLYGWAWLGIATIIWLGGRWSLLVLAFPPVALELYHGNVHLLIAAAIALGFRHPWAWSFVLLTKPTAGVGLVWFAVRREWRSLGVALGVTAGACAVSLVVAPWLWTEWIGFLAVNLAGTPGGPSVPVPLPIRLGIAVLVVAWGARTDRPWTVAVASTIALPVLWFAGFAVLTGALPGLRERARRSTQMVPAVAALTSAPTSAPHRAATMLRWLRVRAPA